MQQELMVAALQCHESGAYNRFVNDLSRPSCSPRTRR